MSIRKICTQQFEIEVENDFQAFIVPKINDFINKQFLLGTQEIGLPPNTVMRTIANVVNSYKFIAK